MNKITKVWVSDLKVAKQWTADNDKNFVAFGEKVQRSIQTKFAFAGIGFKFNSTDANSIQKLAKAKPELAEAIGEFVEATDAVVSWFQRDDKKTGEKKWTLTIQVE